MTYQVISGRLKWPEGTRLSDDDLVGCNIEALVAGNHLRLASDNYKKRQPVAPVPDKTADEPKEQD